ncbi:hypothetical protein ACH5RR_028999 [Cinchona calisaya]|uniref:Uncharacterized protein n=1 Tax=Cinchona calisaya TaxID=153742 RepID=A0ABD2YVN7_9GENT
MASTWVDPILNDLEFLANDLDMVNMDRGDYKMMRMELKFLRTFLCAKKWRNEDVEMESFLFSVENAVLKSALDIHSVCPRSTDNGSSFLLAAWMTWFLDCENKLRIFCHIYTKCTPLG